MHNSTVTEPVTDAMWASGSTGESLEVLDAAKTQICELFSGVLCHASSYPVLICGSHWMREQNLLAVLILLLLQVPVECISADYALSVQDVLADSRGSKSKAETQFIKDMVGSRTQWVNAIKEHLDNTYSGVEAYLMKGGLTSFEIGVLRETIQASSKLGQDGET
ncbi:unnamed protein product [Aureobasidium uvarum]|uniref:Uncharacterized protein n=1 Tax=Aureobasidium uvarum TaxID=2773716 RepID=A0A9N8PV68_9PEZI|nr:unnamed protein product [Aureobasidium uvarum]